MEPTPAECAAIVDIRTLCEWAGVVVDGGFRASLLEALGRPVILRDVGSITAAEFEAVVAGLMITPIVVAGVAAVGATMSTPLQRGRARQVRYGAVKVLGLPSEIVPIAPAVGAVTSSALVPVAGSALKKVRLSSLVDSTAEAEVVLLDAITLRKMFDDYETTLGESPHEDTEPSPEQLSAVHQLITAGCPPYVDFSLFGPHGGRLLKKLSLVLHHFNPGTGAWQRLELPGPPDHLAWVKSWMVYECALLLLGAVRVERLKQYSELIRSFLLQYGSSVWPIVYQADVRMRLEQFERLRRGAEIELARLPAGVTQTPTYDPALPWDGVFGLAIRDKAFWDKEVREKCLLFLTRVQGFPQLLSQGTVLDATPFPGASGSGGGGGGPRPPAPLAGHQGSSKSKKKAGKAPYAEHRNTAPGPGRQPAKGGQSSRPPSPCRLFQEGRCREPCPWLRLHAPGAGGVKIQYHTPKGGAKGGKP
jgi:hypothetical protein